MVGTHAGAIIGEVALAIEMGADAVDIGKTIHPHPTLGESIASWVLHCRVEHFHYRDGIERLLQNHDVIGMNHQF
jgi:hypothetical protein